jgi:hypothetical protein
MRFNVSLLDKDINMNKWPLQSECDQFYGNPRGRDGNVSPAWYEANITKITPPFKVMFGHISMTKLVIHKKCAQSAQRILNSVWDKIGHDQAKADALGISKFSGSFNYRVIRGGNRLSMHAYACAWDWDAPENMMNDSTPLFTKDHPFAVAHAEENWEWGGLWTGRSDAMHWQAARVG